MTWECRQWASLERRQGGNGSDSESPLGGNGAPYRRRSPQHPFWLYFLDPVLEANFVSWQAQQQYQVCIPCSGHSTGIRSFGTHEMAMYVAS